MKFAAAVRNHWPEYLMEAWGLGCFMVSACVFTALFEHPGSRLHGAIPDAFTRRALTGIAMGATAIGIIYSPWGRRSGAHLNPSVTLTFLSLGKIHGWDALFYILAQFAGGVLGVDLADWLLGGMLRHSAVNYAVTVPGKEGEVAAFCAEFLISGFLMATVLAVSNHEKLAARTGLFAGALIAAYVTFEAPLSGMSMNPARTFGSALPAHLWSAWWIYLSAPVFGMLLAGRIYHGIRGGRPARCAKLHHSGKDCIFCCNHRTFAGLL
jgi:aquaporin Z